MLYKYFKYESNDERFLKILYGYYKKKLYIKEKSPKAHTIMMPNITVKNNMRLIYRRKPLLQSIKENEEKNKLTNYKFAKCLSVIRQGKRDNCSNKQLLQNLNSLEQKQKQHFT